MVSMGPPQDLGDDARHGQVVRQSSVYRALPTQGCCNQPATTPSVVPWLRLARRPSSNHRPPEPRRQTDFTRLEITSGSVWWIISPGHRLRHQACWPRSYLDADRCPRRPRRAAAAAIPTLRPSSGSLSPRLRRSRHRRALPCHRRHRQRTLRTSRPTSPGSSHPDQSPPRQNAALRPRDQRRRRTLQRIAQIRAPLPDRDQRRPSPRRRSRTLSPGLQHPPTPRGPRPVHRPLDRYHVQPASYALSEAPSVRIS